MKYFKRKRDFSTGILVFLIQPLTTFLKNFVIKNTQKVVAKLLPLIFSEIKGLKFFLFCIVFTPHFPPYPHLPLPPPWRSRLVFSVDQLGQLKVKILNGATWVAPSRTQNRTAQRQHSNSWTLLLPVWNVNPKWRYLYLKFLDFNPI